MNRADWTDGTSGDAGTATGVFNTAGGTTVNVSDSGEIAFIQTGLGSSTGSSDKTNCFSHGAVSPDTSALVDNDPTPVEMIALSKSASKTLTFSQAVDNLFFAVVSLNGNGYRFNQDFDIVSTGTGFWGTGTLTKSDLGNGQYQLNGSGEPHGVIRFTGTFSAITWSSLTNENWNGFTVGTYGVAPIPEPATHALMALGAPVTAGIARRRSSR